MFYCASHVLVNASNKQKLKLLHLFVKVTVFESKVVIV